MEYRENVLVSKEADKHYQVKAIGEAATRLLRLALKDIDLSTTLTTTITATEHGYEVIVGEFDSGRQDAQESGQEADAGRGQEKSEEKGQVQKRRNGQRQKAGSAARLVSLSGAQGKKGPKGLPARREKVLA